MKYNIFLRMAAFLLALSAVLTGCEPEDLRTIFVPSGESAGYADLPVRIEMEGVQTKTPALSGADDALLGGALFLVYRSSTKQLDSYQFYSPEELADARSLRLSVPLTDCDIYVLGNLLAVNKENPSRTTHLVDALGPDFPADEAGLEALVYRLDGGDLNPTWRRETMAEVARYGIPFGAVDKQVPVSSLVSVGTSVPRERPRWMFSRVEVTVDHGLFDGGDPAKTAYFTNRTLKMRHTNLRLTPFSSSPMRAETAGDVGDGDLDPAMSNGTSNTYVFYVPENMQGSAPESAFAAEPAVARKGRLKVPSNTLIPAACRNLGTYVEFKGTLDKSVGGFGGDVTYQFYLGANETTDFNLQRGRKYRIRLKFTADGLFHPDWRVQAELSDSRLFRLTADPAFTTDIGDVNTSRTLAVRPKRAGTMYVYMNPSGRLGGQNLLRGKEHRTPEGFVMKDLSDCAWHGAFMTAGSADAAWLSERGITPVWDKDRGCLSFSVTDAARFGRHLGETRSFTLTLLPGGTLTTSFTLRLMQDLSWTVAGGKSLTEEFYLGQKRSVSVSGFLGKSIKYAAVQEGCGPAASSARNANVQWKSTPSAQAPFPTCALDAEGRVLLSADAPAYANQGCSGTLDIYAFYPNRFQASHNWPSKNGRIVFFSDDYLNDSLEAEIRISEPVLRLWAPKGKDYPWNSQASSAASRVDKGTQYAPVLLCIDGNVLTFDRTPYASFDGRTALKHDSFDPALYERLLRLSLSRGTVLDGQSWLLDAVKTDGHESLYIGDSAPAGHPLEAVAADTYRFRDNRGRTLTKTKSDQVTLGSVVLQAPAATGLFPQRSEFWVAATRLDDLYVSTSGKFTWDHNDGKLISHYFALVDAADGSSTDRIEIDVNTSFRGGDTGRLSYETKGPRVTYSVGSKDIEPVIDCKWVDDTRLKWIYDSSRQVSSHGGQVVPGELLVPYGPQQFTITYTNRWDQRKISKSCTIGLVHNINLAALYVFNTEEGRVFVVPQRNADLLARKGNEMTRACRRFCLEAIGVNFGEYFYTEKTSGYDYAYHTEKSPTHRGKYSSTKKYEVEMTFNGAVIPKELYREEGLSHWDEASARDFLSATYSSPYHDLNWRYFLYWGQFLGPRDPDNDEFFESPNGEQMGYGDRFYDVGHGYGGSAVGVTQTLRYNDEYTYWIRENARGVDHVRYFLWLDGSW